MDLIDEEIKKYFKLEELNKYDVIINKGSIGNKLSNDTNTKIRGYILDNDKKIVANVRNSNFSENVRKLSNLKNSKTYDNLYEESHKIFGLENIYLRESNIYKNIDSDIKGYLPKFIDNILIDDKNVIITEYFSSSKNIPSIDLVIDFLVKLHSTYLGKEKDINNIGAYNISKGDFVKSKNLLLMILDNFGKLYEKTIDISILSNIEDFIKEINKNLEICDKSYKTLNHGDYSYKNICLLEDGNLCVYDWEFSNFGNPQYDIINFMEYDTVNYINKNYVEDIVNKYIEKVKKQTKITLNKKEFYILLKQNLYISFINRIMIRLIMNKIFPLELSDKILENWIKLYKILN